MQLRPPRLVLPSRIPVGFSVALLVVFVVGLPGAGGAKSRKRAKAPVHRPAADAHQETDDADADDQVSPRRARKATSQTGDDEDTAARARKTPRTRRAAAASDDASDSDDDERDASETGNRGRKRADARDADDEADHDDDDDEDRPHAPRKPAGGPSVRASTEVSGYTDSDAVHVLSPTVAGSVGDEVAGWSVGGSYLVDAVSAASVDIVSTASGHWTEKRHVGAASADFKAGGAAVSLAGGFSREPDYLSLGGGGVVSFELLDKNLMPFIGGSYGHDLVGRHGDPQSTWPVMNKVSLKTGATFVVNASTIAALSFDAIFERGYLAKPYRYLPIVAPGVADTLPAGASVDLVKSVNQFSVDENVPTARDRYAVSGRLAHRWEGATFRGDQRLYRDSWGLLASTTDIHQYFDIGTRIVFWPHVRAHVQRGVDFWQRVFEQIPDPAGGPPGIPTYRAGDRELGPLYTLTGGLGLRARLSSDVHAPWTLSFQFDTIYTRYLDALYITRRRALFGALSLEAGFD